MGLETVGTPIAWICFTAIILIMLVLDLGVFHRKAHTVSLREAAIMSAVWVSLALLFNVGVFIWYGNQRGLEFFTGYIIEKALSVDNLFVFVMVFSYFAVPPALHHWVLFWGILGALLMRGLFIIIGAALLQKFHWIIYIFGAFLVYTGIKFMVQGDEEVLPDRNPLYRLFKRIMPIVPEYRGSRFFVIELGRRHATPLALVVLTVEVTDLIFALDSIPAVFAVTNDPFIVYTSNIFAILGLRALYFLIAGVMGLFHYLKIGLALVLMFVGLKMLVSNFYHVPIPISLAVIAVFIGGAVLLSILRPLPTAHGGQSPEALTSSETDGPTERRELPQN
jgi:tellurite resistance protein TerC